MSDEIEHRVLQARIQLALRHPFLATAIMRLPIRDATDFAWCETMCTDGYHIFFDAGWVGELSGDELQGVIAHEVLHVVFGHADRRGGRLHAKWNVACDLAINLLLMSQGQTLPTSGLIDLRFRGMSAEMIYQQLPDPDNADSPFSNIERQVLEGGNGRIRLNTPVKSSIGPDLFDSNDTRLTPLQDDDAPDDQSRREMRRTLISDLRGGLNAGSEAFVSEELSRAKEPHVDWKALLRGYLTERVKCDWSNYPFAKKHLWRGIYMPSVGVQAPGHILFAIDTSGSMSIDSISSVAAEIRSLRDAFPSELTVVQCDAKVQKIEHYDVGDPTPIPEKDVFHGRGGTDFRPVFDLISQQEVDARLIIYATDGFGEFPSRAPDIDCIWMLTPRSVALDKLPFGYGIRMDD